MRPTVEANYRASLRGGAWWSAARCGRERERGQEMGYEPDWNEPGFYDEGEGEIVEEFDTLEEKEGENE